MDKLEWIKNLVLAEQQMEDTGVVDFSAGFDPQTELEEATIDYLHDLKAAFVDAASAFNQLKGSVVGNLKIYGISKTKADFMLFRNGYKLIFSLRAPGVLGVSLNSIGSNYLPGQTAELEAEKENTNYLKARWGAFGELTWTHQDQSVRMDNLVRYYLSRFVRESAK